MHSISPSYFYKHLLHCSLRLKKDLERGRKSIFEVMSDVGYTDDKAFREVFKKITGLSPLDYRNKYSKENVAP